MSLVGVNLKQVTKRFVKKNDFIAFTGIQIQANIFWTKIRPHRIAWTAELEKNSVKLTKKIGLLGINNM